MPYGLDCRECPRERKCNAWGVESLAYKHEGEDLMGTKWPVCPSSYLNDPHILLALEITNCARVAPLADWPSGWAAWVVKYMQAIHQAVEERKAEEVQKNGQW